MKIRFHSHTYYPLRSPEGRRLCAIMLVLSLIQDAVAEVMGANLQGQDAANQLLSRILQAVEGITIGDDTIGRAARRYESRMARMGGGL